MMNPYIEQVNTYLANRRMDQEDSVLELLCHFYTIDNPVDNAAIRCRFQMLGQILQQLAIGDHSKVIDLACDLCTEHMRIAFLEDVHVGFCLSNELTTPAG